MYNLYNEKMSNKQCKKYDSSRIMDKKKTQCFEYKSVWMCPYEHVLDELRRKLDNKAKKFVFVGNNDQSKAYKLYNLISKRFIIKRGVLFLEDVAFDRIFDKKINIEVNVPQEEKKDYL